MLTTETIYTVYAYSPSQNQEIRRVELADPHKRLTEAEALTTAEFWAITQNAAGSLGAHDWQPRVKLETVGLGTIPQIK